MFVPTPHHSMLLKQRIPIVCLAVFVVAQSALLLSYASRNSPHNKTIVFTDPLTRVGFQIHGATDDANPSGDGAFMPQSCSKSMEYNVMGQHEFEKWSHAEIDAHRAEWQDWVENTLSSPSEPGYEKFMSAVDPILAEFGYFDVATVNATDGKSASGHIPLRRDRGIVVTVAEKNPSAWLSAQVDFLRSYGCNLPIEVWAYEQEITAEIVQTIAKLSTRQAPVFYRVVQDYRHLYRIKEDHGYQIKLAAIANSAFREILYLDSDVIPFKNPELLFESPEFKRYGSIFWVDYWKMHPYNPAWRLFGLECVDEWEQESGMMVIDRKRAWFAIRLAGYFWRDLAATKWHQNFLLGDKDFFRLSWRATSTPAFFIPHWLTPAGLYLPLSNKFCGITMVQHDVEGGPLFAHINLLKRYILSKKYVPGNSILTHVKRYKLPPFRDYPFPAGPLPRTKLKWAHTRGFKASLPNIDEVQCVDIDDGERFGVSPVTEIVPLSNINPSFGKDLDRVLGGYIDAELKKSSYHPE